MVNRDPNLFVPGQRWISESEPELGLGTILRVTDRTVTAVFRASRESRQYSRANAPLRRVHFRAGDTIRTQQETSLKVDAVVERHGLLYYKEDGREVCETELSDTITFSTPEERFLAGQCDPPPVFDLRVSALEHQHRRRKSKVRGFAGGRIDLISHQLYIASEVSGRLAPRVLLADEVGLGKTIEACLILHRLLLTGRAQRVLILLPESLVHQWFIELLRRFNLWFHIFDEERCQAIEAVNPEANPFLDDQLIVCSIRLCMDNERRAEQVLDAGWDILVVDEAHHLAWSPEKASPEYGFVEALGSKTPGLLLLTATPEQLGIAGHFARLRLLDPDRFYDLKEFMSEIEHYRDVARQAEQLTSGPQLDALLDQHGTGRVSFRNTRKAVAGFPKRIAQLAALPSDATRHERLDWLVDLLRTLEPQKVLLICRTQAKVVAIEAGLRQRMKDPKAALFHEGLSLLQRDRNAAWFAEPNGARILICSEIGSEGRNFQFAHHLVLFDLPLDPELLEQRIGRLDRIGQTSEVHVHVPYVIGTQLEVLTRWYHEGLNAFEQNLEGGNELLDRFGARVHDLMKNFRSKELDRLIEDTREAGREIATRLQEGRDRLLEMNSFRPAVAAKLVEEIRAADADRTVDDFMVATLDYCMIPVEEVAPRTYRLGSAGVLADSFPGLPSSGFTVTSDRARALTREDVQFLTWDHPLVTGALDLMLGAEKGNSCFAEWPDDRTTAFYLEAVFVLESIAPPQLHIDRFLPATPLRILVDHTGKDLSATIPRTRLRQELKAGEPHDVLDNPELREDLFPRLLAVAQGIAEGRVEGIVTSARQEMTGQLQSEIRRIRELQKVNRSVRPEEIQLLEDQHQELDAVLQRARLRLDAVRFVYRGT